MNYREMLINNARKAMLDNITALDKKSLQQELESHLKLEFAYKDEMDRLNNIINKLEKYHIKSMENLENTEDFKYVGTNHIKILYEEHKRTLDKLKELKEGKNSHEN